MSKESYARGFAKVATAHGVDPVRLIKFALSDGKPKDLSPAEGAAIGATGGGIVSAFGGPFAIDFGKELKHKADIMENEAFSRLKRTDPQYKSLYRKHGPAIDAATSARGRLGSLMSDLDLAATERDLLHISKISIPTKEKILHPLQYRKIVNEFNRAGAKVQSLQDAGSKLRDEIGAYEASARPLTSRSAALREMAGKKIRPRMVRAGGRLAPWIGYLLPPIVGGLAGSAAASKSKK